MKLRKYLTQSEVSQLVFAASAGKYGARNQCLLLLMFHHGLRVSEALALRLSDIDLNSRIIHIHRLKNGLDTTQPLIPEEAELISAWLKIRGERKTDYLFVSRRGGALNRKTVWGMLRDFSRLAHMPLHVHPHMLRHSCGYALANFGTDTRLIQDYLGHRNIQHTVCYTATNPARFSDLWQPDFPAPPPAKEQAQVNAWIGFMQQS